MTYEKFFCVNLLLHQPVRAGGAVLCLHHIRESPFSDLMHQLVLVDIFSAAFVYGYVEDVGCLDSLASVEIVRVEPASHVQICEASVERALSAESIGGVRHEQIGHPDLPVGRSRIFSLLCME